jgi:3-hydroxyisobutyrate dehydrogenase/2-hydroxy-3-oxopropionate reductase
MAKARVGVIGAGRMGLAMVGHLRRHDYPVIVTDIDSGQIKKATALGAEAAKSAAEIGAVCDFAIIAVGYDPEVLAVTTGQNGLFDAMKRGGIVAISSTCAPDTVEKLAELGRPKGIEIYDAPICRGRRAADDGTLLAVVGGSDEVVERARLIYSTFCSDIVHIGPVGHGQIAKAINNFALWVNGLALIEAGRLAETFGVDLPQLRKALLISTGKSGALEGWSTMSFAWALKDMQIVSRMTDRANLGLPLIGAVRELVKEGRKIKQTDPPDWTGTGTDLT